MGILPIPPLASGKIVMIPFSPRLGAEDLQKKFFYEKISDYDVLSAAMYPKVKCKTLVLCVEGEGSVP